MQRPFCLPLVLPPERKHLCKGARLILSVELWISLSAPGWSGTAHHCKRLNNNTSSAVQGAVILHVWTNNEVVLLLNITLEYYVIKLIKHKIMSPDTRVVGERMYVCPETRQNNLLERFRLAPFRLCLPLLLRRLSHINKNRAHKLMENKTSRFQVTAYLDKVWLYRFQNG